MPAASRTPEGFPSHCPLCGAETSIEFSTPTGDAPCPSCGQLVWQAEQIYQQLRSRLTDMADVSRERISVNARLADVTDDSLSLVEAVMELEEEFDQSLPDEDIKGIATIGDLIRLILRRRGES